MADNLEILVQEKMHRLYKAHYAFRVYWWPFWRSIYSGRKILKSWQQISLVKEGQSFLDYGCGTGCFTISAADIVGARGTVYALDCFPRQLEIVAKNSRKKGYENIETILSDRDIGLPARHVDVIWMCDVFHEVPQKRVVVDELHRVLKKDGILSIYDGMKDKVLEYTGGLFTLDRRDGKLLIFHKR